MYYAAPSGNVIDGGVRSGHPGVAPLKTVRLNGFANLGALH
jgi:hypothetical protein